MSWLKLSNSLPEPEESNSAPSTTGPKTTGWSGLREVEPRLRLVIAPRYTERAERIAGLACRIALRG